MVMEMDGVGVHGGLVGLNLLECINELDGYFYPSTEWSESSAEAHHLHSNFSLSSSDFQKRSSYCNHMPKHSRQIL